MTADRQASAGQSASTAHPWTDLYQLRVHGLSKRHRDVSAVATAAAVALTSIPDDDDDDDDDDECFYDVKP